MALRYVGSSQAHATQPIFTAGFFSVWLASCLVSSLTACNVTGTITLPSSNSQTDLLLSQAALQEPLAGVGDGTGITGWGSSTVLSLSAVSPIAGGANTLIALSGNNFQSGATISIGGVACTGSLVISPTLASCTVPSLPAGTLSVLITNPDLTSATLASAFTYNAAPTLTSISPPSGSSGQTLTLTGTGFTTTVAPTVSLGGSACTLISSTATGITCTLSAHAPGITNGVVTNSDGQTATLVNSFTYSSVGTQIVSGLAHSCALVNGGVQCWGDNTYGQLGNGTTTQSSVPTSVSGLTSGVQAIASGDNHTCALTSGGVQCWGDNFYGQLGSIVGNGTHNPQSSPTAATSLGNSAGVTAITAGANHTCANTPAGLQCWGSNQYGQLGNSVNSGTTNANPTPLLVNGSSVIIDDFETNTDVGYWAASTGTLTASQSVTKFTHGTGSMQWAYSSSATALARTISTTLNAGTLTTTDLSNYNQIQVQFYNDSASGATRTLSMVLTSESGATQTYSQAYTLGTTLPANAWTSFTVTLSSPTSVTGSGFTLNTITQITLQMQDSIDQTGTIYWDALTLISSSSNTNYYIPNGYFETAADLTAWTTSTSGNFGPTVASKPTLSTTQYVTGSQSMEWDYSLSKTTPLSTVNTFSAAIDFSSYSQIQVHFYNDANTGATRTLSIILASASGTSTYSLTQTLGTTLPSNAWTTFTSTLSSGTTTGTFALTAVTSVTLKMTDSSDLSGTVYWDALVLVNPTAINTNSQEIQAGANHTCTLNSGNVHCFGLNQYGQLGNATNSGTMNANPSPLLVGTLTSVQSFTAGYFHTCAVQNGAAYCWGLNDTGQFGNSTTSAAANPVPQAVTGWASDTQRLTGGYKHTCGIKDGAAYCWGLNGNGQLGTNDTTTYSVPTSIKTSTGTTISTTEVVQALVAGYEQTCAIISGSLKCWGANGSGQLGNNTISASQTSPTAVYGLNGAVLNLSGGFEHTCAVVNGGAQCWGWNGYGQLGNNSTTNSSVPITVNTATTPAIIPLSFVQDVQGGMYHSCALQNGGVLCWGANVSGQLGNNSTTASLVPVSTTTLTSGVQTLSVGADHSCGIQNGKLWCWGANGYGQLGTATTVNSTVPVATSNANGVDLSTGVQAVASGAFHSCAIQNGSLSCFGYNLYGQLGDNTTTQKTSPVTVSPDKNGVLFSSGVQSVATGTYHSCAIKNGQAWCWGLNNYGQLGNNSSGSSNIPVQVLNHSGTGVLTGVTSLVTGAYHTCALANGQVGCWGYNHYGQLGNSTSTNQILPLLVTGSNGAQSLTAGSYHTCIGLNGGIQCTGYNAYGQLGTGNQTSTSLLSSLLSF